MLAATRAFGLRAPAVARPSTRLALAPSVRPLEQSSYLGGSLAGATVSSAPSRGSLVVMAGMACTISGKGSNKKRRTTSGFRARLQSVSGVKVLKNRRKKGRHVLAPASQKKSGGKK